jgi:homoserine acetyltransferase
MRKLLFKEAIKKYGASNKCDMLFEIRVVRATDTDDKPLAILGEVKTNCGHDAFLKLSKEYESVIEKHGSDAILELLLK